ncbi:MAG: hypothetical protein Q9165_003755 [Trypethelium subeluteriae]
MKRFLMIWYAACSASSAPRPSSAGSSYEDASEGELGSGINRTRLHPDRAREQFFSNNVDAHEVDFSDRVSTKRKSYRTSSRRRRKGEADDEDGEFSDEDESFEKKLARLRREVEEVKAEYDQRNEHETLSKDTQENGASARGGTGNIAQLSRMLDELHNARRDEARSNGALGERLGRDFAAVQVREQTSSASQGRSTEHTKFTIEYAPNYEQSHALAKAADLDSRLALLEKYIGSSASSVPGAEDTNLARPILPALESLEQQLTTLSTSSPSSLDAIARKVHEALQEAEHLDELRKQSRSSTQESAGRGTSGRGGPSRPDGSGQQDGEEGSGQGSKINALYGTLPTIENLAPLLPSVLDRLHTLRAVHANAARASESLDTVEARQQEMAEDIRRWREGLEKVEQAMKGGEGVMAGNMKAIEGWVKGLEDRMKRIDQ